MVWCGITRRVSPFRQNHFRFGLQQTPVGGRTAGPRRRRARRATEQRRELHPFFSGSDGALRPAAFAALLHRATASDLLARRFRADAVPVGRFPLKTERIRRLFFVSFSFPWPVRVGLLLLDGRSDGRAPSRCKGIAFWRPISRTRSPRWLAVERSQGRASDRSFHRKEATTAVRRPSGIFYI